MFKVNNKNIRTKQQTTKQHRSCSEVFIINFDHISQLLMLSLLLALNRQMFTGLLGLSVIYKVTPFRQLKTFRWYNFTNGWKSRAGLPYHIKKKRKKEKTEKPQKH